MPWIGLLSLVGVVVAGFALFGAVRPTSSASGLNAPSIAAFEQAPEAASTSLPQAPAGWSTEFSDDFRGAAGSGADSQWSYETGPGSTFGTGEIETMTNSTANVAEDGNGNLDLTAVGQGGSWTSGRIQTASSVASAPAGGEQYVAAAIKQPSGGSGYWPAFWMLGSGQWPENGEIDIMEDVNSLSEVSGTVHCGTDPGGPCKEGTGLTSGLHSCGGCQDGYHVYSMLLDRKNTADESITFYLDGNAYYSVSESQVGAAVWQAAFDHGMHLILDLAISGDYPNDQCGCTTPGSSTVSGRTMSVAYVVAYDTAGGAVQQNATTRASTSTGNAGGSSGSSGGGSNTAGRWTGQWTGQITGYRALCLDDSGAGTALYNPVQVFSCNRTGAQQWTLVQADGTIRDYGRCLDVAGGRTSDGTKVDLYPCNGTGAQVWVARANRTLYNPKSDKCLDDTNWGGSGTQLQIWDCSGNANQQWLLPTWAL
jgi:Ricin-type beta-trefoil lectin domain/Glycosyl hydrolases family 16